jgi:4-amino-4-deoxy-L-arabinose transferase-like glycosyltransferase
VGEGRSGKALLVVLLLLLFAELPGTWLFDQDETRYAEIGREMLASGDWVTPTLNGARYDEKPPVTYWVNAASIGLLGNNPYAARLPARLAALGTALLLLAWGGTWAAVILLASPLAFAMGRLDLTDGLLSFLVTAALFALRRFLAEEPWTRRSMGWLAAVGLACGLAVLTKGLVGLGIPAVALLAYAAATGRWNRVLESIASPAPIVLLLVVAPWFLLMERAHPGFNGYFWWDNHVGRFAEGGTGRDHGFWYPWAVVAAGFLPWLLLLRWRGPRADPDGFLLRAWFLAIPVAFTFSSSTLIPYFLPSIPAAALLAAREVRPWCVKAAWIVVALQAAVVLALPHVAEARSWRPLAERAAAEKGALVVTYRCHANAFMLRFERPIPAAGHDGEMATNVAGPPEHFWTGREFWRRWESGERVVALVNDRHWGEFRARSKAPVRLLAEGWQGRRLVANYP